MRFIHHDGDTWRCFRGRHALLTRTDENWILHKDDGTRYHFNAQARVDTICDLNGNRIALTYDGNDNLSKITDSVEREIHLAYDGHLIRRVYEAPGPSSGRCYEYRYCLMCEQQNPPWYAYALAQVVRHAPGSDPAGADSLIVLHRYYYDCAFNLRTMCTPGGGYTSGDTSWANNRHREDRLNIWYGITLDGGSDGERSLEFVRYQEVVNGDEDDNLDNDVVVYKGFVDAFWKPNLEEHPRGLDSTKIYHYEGEPSIGSHDPLDATFQPQPPTSNYYVKTIDWQNEIGNKVWERIDKPSAGISIVTNYGIYDCDLNPSSVTDPDGNTTEYEYQTYELCGETRYLPSPAKVKYTEDDSVLYYQSAHDPDNNPVFFLPDSTVDELGRRTDYFYD